MLTFWYTIYTCETHYQQTKSKTMFFFFHVILAGNHIRVRNDFIRRLYNIL